MVLGLTGGVGAGKSTVAEILKSKYNAKLILSDDVAKELMLPGQAAYNKVVEHFGQTIICDNKMLDNKKLAEIVFNDQSELTWLNNATHPIVIDEINRRITKYKEDGSSIIVLESALLAKAGCDKICDHIWFIKTNQGERIVRLKNDRGYDEGKSVSVINKQDKDEWFEETSDEVITNDGDINSLETTIEKSIKNLKKRFDF